MAAHPHSYHSPYKDAFQEGDDLGIEMAMQHVAPRFQPERRQSVDSLCMEDDGPFPSLMEHKLSSPPSGPVNGDHVPQHVKGDIPQEASAGKQPYGFIDTSREVLDPPETMPALQPPPPPGATRRTGMFRDIWLWEIISIIFSILCMLTVVILASRLNGTWLSKWTFPLQPSTLISTLVTAVQSSMMLVIAEVFGQLKWLHMSLPKPQPLEDLETFESAGRGPLGSLSLLYRWQPDMAPLAPLVYTAAFVTVAALAMGPFAQQIVSIQTDSLEPQEDVNSTIAVSNSYNNNNTVPGLFFDFKNESFGFGQTSNGAFVTQSDMQGAFYSGIYGLGGSILDFGCPSSNCTWDTFTSLGFCSTCRNVTASTRIVKSPYATGNTQFYTPGGWYVSMSSFVDVFVKSNSTILTATSLDDLFPNVATSVIIQVNPTGFNVTECSVDWCAKQYSNMTAINGTLQNQYAVVQDLPLYPVKGQDYGGLARGQTVGGNWVYLLTTDSNGGNVSSAPAPFQESGFNVSICDQLAIVGFVTRQLNISSETNDVFFGSGQDAISAMANVTTGMTNKITTGGSKSIAKGVVWQVQSIIRIQFAWLALPSALVLFSAILLVSTVLMTRHFRAPVWKSSTLPILYHGVREWDDEEEREVVEGRLERVHSMKERAGSTRVRIFNAPEGGSWLVK